MDLSLYNEKSIDRWVLAKYKKLTAAQKIAFCSTFITGIVVHITPITNLLWNHDSNVGIANPPLMTWMLGQGKWLSGILTFLERGGSGYNITFSYFTGLVLLSVAGSIFVSVFQIKNKVFAAFAGASMAAFPSVMSMFVYHVTGYLWTICLCMLSILVRYKYSGWRGAVFSTFFLVVVLGLYPPYITIVASGYLLLLLQEIILTDKKEKQIFLYAWILLGQLIAGLGIYYGILQVCLKRYSQSLSEYYNIDKMAHFNIKRIPVYIFNAYKNLFDFYRFDASGTGVMRLFYCAILLLMLISIVFLIYKSKLYRRVFRLLLFFLFGGLFPLAVNLNEVLSQGYENPHWLMKYSFVMIPLATIKFANDGVELTKRSVKSKKKLDVECFFSLVQQWAVVLVFFLTIYRWAITCSEGYLRTLISYEKAYSVLTNVADDIYEFNMMSDNTVVLLTYSNTGIQNVLHEDLPQYDAYTGIASRNFILSYHPVMEKYIGMILGIDFTYANDEIKREILSNPEYDEMPCYPYNGYIQEIEGVLVVKITPEHLST